MPRLAVVDDDPTMLELLVDVVAEHNWEMLHVPEGDTVPEVVRHELPDAVLLAVGPVMAPTRWDLLHRLLAEPATAAIPIIIWSSDPRQFKDQRAWLETHQIPILSKPFELNDLYHHLDHVLRRSGLPSVPQRMGERTHQTRSAVNGPLNEYAVPVTNARTGQEHDVVVLAHGPTDAQTDALHWMFEHHQWRHCTAAVPRQPGSTT